MAVRPDKSKDPPCPSLITKLPEIRSGPLGVTVISVLSAIYISSDKILIPEASVTRNDDDSRFGYAKPPAILFGVVADFDAGWDVDVFIDNHPVKFRMPADIHAVHQDALIHVRIAVDTHFG